jgi:hypothetical protein
MPIKITYDDRGLQEKMKQLTKWKGITFAEVLRRHARLCAVEMCRRTQPFGTDASVRQIGENAVERDIRKIYKDSANLLNMARSWKNTPWQRAVVTALEKEDFNNLWILLQESKSWLRDSLVEAPSPSVHQAHRTKRGRVRKTRFFGIVKDAAALLRYIKDRQMLVGFTKSVWWTCAQQIKTTLKRETAGFPAWVRRHKAPGTVLDSADDPFQPSVEMRTDLPWMNAVLPSYERDAAVRIVKEKMIKYIEMTWKGELRRVMNQQKAA